MPLSDGGGSGSSTPPPGGWAKTDLETAVQNSLTKADGAVPGAEKGAASGVRANGTDILADVKMTQAAYDGLATKSATTLYFIVG